MQYYLTDNNFIFLTAMKLQNKYQLSTITFGFFQITYIGGGKN